MENKIIIINEKKGSFMLKATQAALTENGYEVVEALPNVDEINAEKKNAQMILVYAGEYLVKNTEILFYIKDICIEAEIQLCLIGYPEEIEDIYKLIPENVIHRAFERPVNVKELVEKVDEDMVKLGEDAKKKHILIVDDSGMTLRMVKQWLSPNYKVSMANSGASAISFLANNRPDLILLDYEMPVCPGPQLMQMLKSEPSTSDIPIMFFTGKNDKESVASVLSLKPAGYMLKSMEPNEVLQIIEDFFVRQKGK